GGGPTRKGVGLAEKRPPTEVASLFGEGRWRYPRSFASLLMESGSASQYAHRDLLAIASKNSCRSAMPMLRQRRKVERRTPTNERNRDCRSWQSPHCPRLAHGRV